LASLCAPLVWPPVWDRNELSLRGPGARLDRGQESSLSLCVARAGLCVAQCLDSFTLVLHAGAAPRRAVVRYSPLPPAPLYYISAARIRGLVWLCSGYYGSGATAWVRN